MVDVSEKGLNDSFYLPKTSTKPGGTVVIIGLAGSGTIYKNTMNCLDTCNAFNKLMLIS